MNTAGVGQVKPASPAAPELPIAQPTDVFRKNQLLDGLEDAAFRRLVSQVDLIRYGPEEIIFEEDDPGDCLYLIAEGAVKISKRGRAGQQEILAHLSQHDFFGEMALVDSGRRSARASAVGPTVLGQVDRGDWDLLLRLAPHQVLKNFSGAVTKRIRNNNQHFIEEMMRNERLSLLGTTVSSIAHDMNNPISSILTACQFVQMTAQDKTVAKMADIIRDSIKTMEMMTRELVDFSRGKTDLRLQPFTMAELMQGLEQDFAKCRPYVEVRVDVLFDGKLHGDRYRLQRVFGNLIRNAREAMKPNAGDRLHFLVSRNDSTAHFEISDTGCGIAKELLPRLFEPFATFGKANGTGLGLAISKSVVEAHGGTIAAESSEAGTRFTIDLPNAVVPG
jgi:signal transduction histidine kinase